MYAVAIRRDFSAQHFLTGSDWGDENRLHTHHYRLEARLEGSHLDEHGFLVDIVKIEAELAEILAHYRDHTLNDLPEFTGLNPSLEHFCRILCQGLANRLTTPTIRAIVIKLWENDIAWASYSKPVGSGCLNERRI